MLPSPSQCLPKPFFLLPQLETAYSCPAHLPHTRGERLAQSSVISCPTTTTYTQPTTQYAEPTTQYEDAPMAYVEYEDARMAYDPPMAYTPQWHVPHSTGGFPLEYAVSDLDALGEEAFLRALDARLRMPTSQNAVAVVLATGETLLTHPKLVRYGHGTSASTCLARVTCKARVLRASSA